jgi:hypothetical protein
MRESTTKNCNNPPVTHINAHPRHKYSTQKWLIVVKIDVGPVGGAHGDALSSVPFGECL